MYFFAFVKIRWSNWIEFWLNLLSNFWCIQLYSVNFIQIDTQFFFSLIFVYFVGHVLHILLIFMALKEIMRASDMCAITNATFNQQKSQNNINYTIEWLSRWQEWIWFEHFNELSFNWYKWIVSFSWNSKLYCIKLCNANASINCRIKILNRNWILLYVHRICFQVS